MPPESRQPAPDLPVTFAAPPVPQPVQLGLTDILAHLITSAEEQARVTPADRARQGIPAQQVDELNRSLANVRRLANELQTELTALQTLRPPDPTSPAST
jgi:hypothetical protein